MRFSPVISLEARVGLDVSMVQVYSLVPVEHDSTSVRTLMLSHGIS